MLINIIKYQEGLLGHVSDVMEKHSEFCNTETRAPELLYLFRKYDYDEIVVVDSNKHPIGIVKKDDVSDEALQEYLHPFDLRAEILMSNIVTSVDKDSTIAESLNLLESSHLDVAPVVDSEGECLGIVKKEDLLRELSR